MPSGLITQIAEISDLREHTNADKLQLCDVNGWQLVCGKGLYENGERIVYITPDTLISDKLADILEIRQHLGTVKNLDGSFVTNEAGEQMLRVRQAKLRGEPSFGTTIPYDVMFEHYAINIKERELGENLADEIGLMKYLPAMRATAGDAEVDHFLFTKYTDIENIRNFPNVLQDGERVVITEKLHGQNLRVGLIEGEFMAGSHGTRRKRPERLADNAFWYPLQEEGVVNLLNELGADHKQVILFGESFGSIQKGYHYGEKNGAKFRAFDICVDGKYLNHDVFIALCRQHNVANVPVLQHMDYSFEKVAEFGESFKTSTLSPEHGMEGLVIRPVEERYDRKVGRVILKYITNAYMFDSGKSDFTEI